MLSDTGPFALIPEWVLDLELSPEAVNLYALLGLYADKNGECFPRRKVLADRMRRSVDTIDRLKKELIAAGVLIQDKRARTDGSQTSNHYTLVRVSPHLPMGGRNGAEGGSRKSSAPRTRPSTNQSASTEVLAAHEQLSTEKDPLALLWDAFSEHVQKPPEARSQRSAYAKLVRECHDVGWTPETVRRRARAYKRHRTFGECELTVAALAKWGEELDRGKRTLTDEANQAGQVGLGYPVSPGDGRTAGNGRESRAVGGDSGDQASSVSVLPPEENARQLAALRARLDGVLDGADGYLEGLSAPPSATLTEDGEVGVVAENDPVAGRAQKVTGRHSRTPSLDSPSSVSASASPHKPPSGALTGESATTLPVGSPQPS